LSRAESAFWQHKRDVKFGFGGRLAFGPADVHPIHRASKPMNFLGNIVAARIVSAARIAI